ncbi:MAG: hypothetical protein AYL29_000910 [Candidatus Bathyarchaeota archaeon B24]|nr:MAG: hypothetical protein AYL29_000910 [Candidatus Bathyarchaeota archaeon B24]RLI25594.1 MAG: hypothetical protein DRO57_03560 [Candidatus Bathyarchaeota archaeon]
MRKSLKRALMESYDSSAFTYDRLYGEEQEAKHLRGIRMMPSIEDAIVLDAGCGSGLLIEKLADTAGLIVGLDFSKAMLRIARDKFKQRNVALVRGDVEKLPFRDDVFDMVFMFTVLQNTPDPSAALKEAYRVLRRSGYLAVSFLKKSFAKTYAERLLDFCGFEKMRYSGRGVMDHIYVCSKKSFYSTSL